MTETMGPPDDRPTRRAAKGRPLPRLWRIYTRFVRVLMTFIFGTTLIALGVLFINYVVLSTPKDRAYRNLDPSVAACADGLRNGWSILAETGRRRLRAGVKTTDDDGWYDPSNDETAAIAADPAWKTKLRCSLQRHLVPSSRAGEPPLDYTLGFLEFQEDGDPYALVATGDGGDKAVTSAMLQGAMESQMRTQHMSAAAVRPVISQLDALKERLSSGSNYVLVFIHGWRHDARLGDQNVADLRLYAAHAARFLRERCKNEPAACDMKVTAIYIGWRGARVDELGLKEDFGELVGGSLGLVSAGVTLFDRKPVAEQVAPGAVSALRTIEGTLAANSHNKMIVFGHSLGGDMLATGLKDDLLKAVRRHRAGETLPPTLGNLVVLINPAAEASKWTDIQREIWNRLASHTDTNTSRADIDRDNDFFPMGQRPVVVSVTAALAFPAGGLRPGDCAWIGLTIDDKFKDARAMIRRRLSATDSMFDTGVDYDWATHDLFPTFKLDFRPAAGYLDRVAARIERRQPKGQSCATFPEPGLLASLESLPIRFASLLAATFPFQTSSIEQSHTIGNLDPPRPAAGVLADAPPSAAPFGTTHELLGLHSGGSERHNPYATLADAPIDCPISNHWLARARAQRKDQAGMFWDSEDLAPSAPGAVGEGKPTARFLHGLQLSGIAPITRADDPFWNVRAFDNALSRHDGYRLTSFICAMNQLVMDDITDDPAPLSDRMSGARQPATATVP